MIFSGSTKTLLCVILVIITYSNAKLAVKSPPDLKSEFNAINEIDYTILTPQNKITYKRAFIGNLILADPPTACEELPSLTAVGDSLYNPVLLTTWGDCHYAQKVKNAEIAGAKMVILVLRHDMETNHPAVRQLPINTNIEVLAISHTHGQRLVEFIQSKTPAPVVEITYSFDVEKHVNYQADSTVSLEFWFSSSDISKASYMFLDELAEILKDFGDGVVFAPRYVLWQCEECALQNFVSNDARCVSGGRYCDPEVPTPGQLSGKEGVIEDLRQICLRERAGKFTLQDDWWKYVSAFGKECVDKPLSEIEGCREKIFTELGIRTKQAVDECMKNSFKGDEGNNADNINLQKELDRKDEMHIDHYPAFYANKERYTGSFRNKYAIKEFICSHFLQDTLPTTCTATMTTTSVSSGSDVALYIVIILVSVLVMAVMLYCVRRSVKRQVMGRMNEEISHIVTQYKQFKDKSNSFSADEEM